MLLTITSTSEPAKDLGYLLHKNPHNARVQSFELSFGQAHVLYPEVSAGRCTAALLLEVARSAWCATAAGPRVRRGRSSNTSTIGRTSRRRS